MRTSGFLREPFIRNKTFGPLVPVCPKKNGKKQIAEKLSSKVTGSVGLVAQIKTGPDY
jgi:hypothetical protein